MMGGAQGRTAQGPAAAGQMRPPDGQEAAQATQSRQRAPEGAWAGPRPLPPEARTAAPEAHTAPRAQAQAHTQASAAPPIRPAADPDVPDWLAERLRQDADQEAQRQRSRVMA